MDIINVAIIGTGNIAKHHYAGYARDSRARVVAVCDLIEDKAKAFAAEHGILKVYADAEKLCADDEVQAVSVCTPHPQHAPVTIAAAQAGKHVICEKPMAVTTADADRMIAACEVGGVKLAVIYQRRWWAAAQRLRRAIDEDRLGRLILADCLVKWKRAAEYYARDPWRGKWDLEGGGVTINQAPHALDMLLWYMGEAAQVHAHWANFTHPTVEVEDTAVATVKFKSGALGVISLCVSQDPGLWSRITVHGDNGSSASVAEIPEGAPGINDLWTLPGDEDKVAAWQTEDLKTPSFPDCHAAQLADFLDAIIENRDPAVTGRAGRKSVALIEAMYRSGRTGEVVTL